MSNMITIKKKDFLKRFRTGFDIARNEYGVYNFNPRRTTITEVLFDVTDESNDFDGCGLVDRKLLNSINPENYSESIAAIKTKADELYLSNLDSCIKELEKLLEGFPKWKDILYSMNIGNANKIAYSNSNFKNLEIAKDMVAGKEPLPAKIIYLIPDEFQIPSFIPELGQSFYEGSFEDHYDFGVQEFKVSKISFSDGFFHRTYDETVNIHKEVLLNKLYSNNTLNVVVEMQSVNTESVLKFHTKELSMFKDGVLTKGSFQGVVKERAEMAISVIQNKLKNI
jgi:hypothetical protein